MCVEIEVFSLVRAPTAFWQPNDWIVRLTRQIEFALSRAKRFVEFEIMSDDHTCGSKTGPA